MDAARMERITRSLAFMLRHQPEKFDIEVDAHGFADTGEVVRALNERLGEPVDLDDLSEAVESGDRRRYEIQGDRIRALYGHSIPVEPGEPSKPPEALFLGIDARDAERARKYGLRGGRRRFLHLALSEDDAIEVGRRIAEEYTIVRVSALEAWEDGVDFYDRGALFLAEEVPTQMVTIGETYDDGEPPRPPQGRGPRRDGGRGRRGGDDDRRRGRGGRRGGRGRDREEERPVRAERNGGSESRGGDDRRPPRRERPDREDRRDEQKPAPRREREPRREERPAARKSAAPSAGFGAGVLEDKSAEPERREAPAPPPESRPEPEPEPAQSRPEPPKPAGPGFGAGL